MSAESEGLKGLAKREAMPAHHSEPETPLMVKIAALLKEYPRCLQCKRKMPCKIKNCVRSISFEFVDGFKGE